MEREKGLLTMDQMAEMLDSVPVAVFVCKVDDQKLLYKNRQAKELFPELDMPGAACYSFAGFNGQCPFCRVGELSWTELRVREYQHIRSRRIYQLSGKLIHWGEQAAHIEYVLDITDKKREERLNEKIKAEMQITLDSISCGLCVYQLEGEDIKPVFHNKAFYDITGYSEESIRSVEQMTSYLNVHPEDVDSLRGKIWELIKNGGVMRETYRLWNDREGQYRWLHLEGTRRTTEEGKTLLYGVYSDVSEQKRLEKELTDANEKTEDIINAIPGGVAIYKVSDVFRPVYFSEGVPRLSGYSVEEYREITKRDAADMIYTEDTAMVVEKLREAILNHTAADVEFRKQHKDGHIVWVHLQARQIGEEDGLPLLQCVFHNISALKETQRERDHLINSIPGGIASYRVEGGRFIPTYFSDGVMLLSGHTREEFDEMIGNDALNVIYEPDRERVLAAARDAIENGTVLNVSYRMFHKNGNLIWIHLNGRRMGPLSDSTQFYAIFTSMVDGLGSISNEKLDGAFIIDKESYELLYSSDIKELAQSGAASVGQPCYAAFHGLRAPCDFCTLKTYGPDEREHEVAVSGKDMVYTACTKEAVWNGIPAYIQYIRDVTEEVHTRLEKERLEMYFQTLIKNLPGGISVIRCEPDGTITPEFISEGFASLTRMTTKEAFELYRGDVFAGIHPDDVEINKTKLRDFMDKGEEHGDLVARFRRGDGSYIWLRDSVSIMKGLDGIIRLNCIYTDISQSVEERIQLSRQYEELILQHYRTPGPNTLMLGHCNITKNAVLELWDSTNSNLLNTSGGNRDDFIAGFSELIEDEEERGTFLETYTSARSLSAFGKEETEQTMECFVKLPLEPAGRYVRFNINMVEAPENGDIIGILTVTDITDQTISERIMRRLSVTSHDYVVDLNIRQDSYRVLASNESACWAPESRGRFSQRVAFMAETTVVPRDREAYVKTLSPNEIESRLKEKGLFTFAYSVKDELGDVRTKHLTVSAIDLRLRRVSLVCTDITSSVREQQSFLSMLAYTFELAGMVNVSDWSFVMYTREMVLENLPPYIFEDYSETNGKFINAFVMEGKQEEAREQFCLKTILRRLGETPEGYEFVFPYKGDDGLRYKQINVLWGDGNHGTICIVRADVTEALAAEQESKSALEKALAMAEEANLAKSNFLSAMSHDIRTPMNAIMGMTALASAHLGEQDKVADYLQKISISSKHLLSLVNDILDMNQIERAQVTLNQVHIFLPEFLEQLNVMIGPQAGRAGLRFSVRSENVSHYDFLGDTLRINQILINLLSNAVKFTPEGGLVELCVTELQPKSDAGMVRYRFTVSDTGIGMSEEFLARVFDPFARDYGVRRIEGTGLGLSIAHGLVGLMNGVISVESRLNEGTSFRVELELEAAQSGDGPSAEAWEGAADINAETLLSGRCFLVAEDNAINAEILSELLKMYGARSVLKPDGAQTVQAFQAAEPGTFDGILLDIQMPNMNGYEACRAIRALNRPDAGKIPIIALSANAFAEDVKAALEAGMNAHVAKPIDIDVLRTTLIKLL